MSSMISASRSPSTFRIPGRSGRNRLISGSAFMLSFLCVWEQFALQNNPWWKQESTADRQSLSLGRTHVQCRDGKPVFDRETVEDFFGLDTEATLFLGEQKHVHSYYD